MNRRFSRRRTRGMGLIDALIALALLAFGMLAMTRFQSRLVSQGTDSQTRLAATQLSDELINLAIVDPLNAPCYTVPEAGVCAVAAARTLTDDWATRVETALAGDDNVTSVLDAATGQLTVTLTWTGKDGADDDERVRTMTAVTDVNP